MNGRGRCPLYLIGFKKDLSKEITEEKQGQRRKDTKEKQRKVVPSGAASFVVGKSILWIGNDPLN